MTLLDIPLLSRDQPWHLIELASWGIKRAEEADARGFPYIVAAQLRAGSGRISSRIAEHPSIVSVWRESAKRERAAFAVLKRGKSGWSISEFFNCAGDPDDVTVRLSITSCGDSSTRAPGYHPGDQTDGTVAPLHRKEPPIGSSA